MKDDLTYREALLEAENDALRAENERLRAEGEALRESVMLKAILAGAFSKPESEPTVDDTTTPTG